MIHHQTWDIVIADTQDINRHVLGMSEEMITVLVDFDTAALKQALRLVG